MRTVLFLAFAATLPLVLSGCLVDMLASTAIGATVEAKQAQSAVQALNYAKKTTSQIEVNNAIQAYSAENGKFPATLQDLVPGFLPSIPTKPDGSPYGYDPKSGTLLNEPITAAPAVAAVETNEQKMARINAAIAQFAAATHYYPGSLQQLVPGYLPSLPLTAKGAEFYYVPENGKLYDPTGTVMDVPSPRAKAGAALTQAPPQQATTPRGPGSGVGGSPVMGEQMTAIGISNQLDNMGSGASSAGSRTRGQAGDVGASHDAQQQKAMNDLGL